MDPSLRILICVPSPILLRGLRELLGSTGRITILDEARDAGRAAHLASVLRPDVILADADLVRDGVDALLLHPGHDGAHSRLVILAAKATAENVREAFRIGASGYLLHDDELTDLPGILADVHAGQVRISRGSSRSCVNRPRCQNCRRRSAAP